MEIKLFEVRDRMTFIACFGILMKPSDVRVGKLEVKSTPLEIDVHNAEGFLLRHAGFAFDYPLVMFGALEGGETQYDPYGWGKTARTIPYAHRYAHENWDSLKSGDVIDIEYILGEKNVKKTSERSDAKIVPQLCYAFYTTEDNDDTRCTEDLGHPGDHITTVEGEIIARWK